MYIGCLKYNRCRCDAHTYANAHAAHAVRAPTPGGSNPASARRSANSGAVHLNSVSGWFGRQPVQQANSTHRKRWSAYIDPCPCPHLHRAAGFSTEVGRVAPIAFIPNKNAKISMNWRWCAPRGAPRAYEKLNFLTWREYCLCGI